MQPGQFVQPDFGKRPALRGFLLLNLAQHAFDQVAGEFQVDRQFDDFRPAPAVLIAEIFPGHLRQIQLDRAVERFDIIGQAPHFLGDGGLLSAQHVEHGFEHVVDQVAHAQGFPGCVGQRQTGRDQCRGVKMPGLGRAVGLLALRQHPGTKPRHRFEAGQQDQAAHGVVEQVKANDHFLRAEIQAIEPVHQRIEHWNDQ
ncbi:hypothetical protein D3C86_1215560 [compost metagenome]